MTNLESNDGWEAEEAEIKNLIFDLKKAKLDLSQNKKALRLATEHWEDAQAAQNTLQHLAQAVQQQAHERIAKVVTSCLQAVFKEDAYEFKIDFERKRGRTEAILRFVRGERNLDPTSSSGGGIVDVAAFALRVACLVLHRPSLSRIVILDEPFKFVSAQYLPNVKAMLQGLAKDLKLQIILVSHVADLAVGNIIEIT